MVPFAIYGLVSIRELSVKLMTPPAAKGAWQELSPSLSARFAGYIRFPLRAVVALTQGLSAT